MYIIESHASTDIKEAVCDVHICDDIPNHYKPHPVLAAIAASFELPIMSYFKKTRSEEASSRQKNNFLQN